MCRYPPYFLHYASVDVQKNVEKLEKFGEIS